MLEQVDLSTEVRRLLTARVKYDDYPEGIVREVDLMTRDRKIQYLAEGVIDGWYGNEKVAEAILKNLYEEVMVKVHQL